jgi:mitochondrial import receptor subunit TOM40
VIQLEQDYTGSDHSVNLKAINPSPVDGTGLYFGSYLQSLTKNIALGVESLWQRAPDGEDLNASYILKYTGTRQDWSATTNIQPQGMVNATYWHKLSEKLDVAAELQLIATPQKRDAVATAAARWELRMATFRAQLDSTGKVSALLEQRFAPSFSFLVAGEIDHFKARASSSVFSHQRY